MSHLGRSGGVRPEPRGSPPALMDAETALAESPGGVAETGVDGQGSGRRQALVTREPISLELVGSAEGSERAPAQGQRSAPRAPPTEQRSRGRPRSKPDSAAMDRQRQLNLQAQARYRARRQQKELEDRIRAAELRAMLAAARAETSMLASQSAALERMLVYREETVSSLQLAAAQPAPDPLGFRRRMRPCCYRAERGFTPAQLSLLHVSCMHTPRDEPFPPPGLALSPENARLFRSFNTDVIFAKWNAIGCELASLLELAEAAPSLDLEARFLEVMGQGVRQGVGLGACALGN